MLETSALGGPDNTDVTRKLYEGFNRRDFDLMLSGAADNVEFVDIPAGQTFRGTKGYRESAEKWMKSFSDANVEVTNVVSSGDYVVVEFIGRGTHDGPMMTPTGEIPPTGKRIEVPFVEVHRFKSGKIVRTRLYYDTASIVRQLGLSA